MRTLFIESLSFLRGDDVVWWGRYVIEDDFRLVVTYTAECLYLSHGTK